MEDMPKGFPRPWSDQYKSPTPYTAESSSNIGVGNDPRIEETLKLGLCSVCALELNEPTMFVQVTNDLEVDEPHGTVSDHGFAHKKCAKLTELFCPMFKRGDHKMIEVHTEPIMGLYRRRYKEWAIKSYYRHRIHWDELVPFVVGEKN